MYSMRNIPTWAKNKPADVQRTTIRVFNETLRDTGSEEKARIASLAAMVNSQKKYEEDKKKLKKSANDLVAELIKQKYNLE